MPSARSLPPYRRRSRPDTPTRVRRPCELPRAGSSSGSATKRSIRPARAAHYKSCCTGAGMAEPLTRPSELPVVPVELLGEPEHDRTEQHHTCDFHCDSPHRAELARCEGWLSHVATQLHLRCSNVKLDRVHTRLKTGWPGRGRWTSTPRHCRSRTRPAFARRQRPGAGRTDAKPRKPWRRPETGRTPRRD